MHQNEAITYKTSAKQEGNSEKQKKNNISTIKYGGHHPFDGQNIQQSGINVISCKSLIHNDVRQDQFREGPPQNKIS